MDANVMVPIDGGDVKKLTAVLNEEDDMVTATSEKPSKEDHPPAGNINPLLLASARVGSWEALNVLLQREDEKKPPMMLPTQEFLQLLEGGSSDQGRAAARDVEDGGDLQHAASASVAAGALLKGVTPDGDTVLHAVAGNCWDGKDFLDYANIIHDRDRDLLFEKNHQGDTPLHCAARAGNSRMVSHLIELAARQGDDAKLKLSRMENKRQETALHEAVRFEDGTVLGRKEMEAFLSAAPDLPREDHAPEPEEWNIVKLLMDADPELANYPQDGVSPLCLAILLGKSTIALTLYDKSGENLSYSGPDGQNALHVAILRDTAMIQYLVRWNKSLTTQVDKDGSTPLHFASSLFYPTRPSILIPSAVQKGKKILIPRALQIVFEANRTALYQADNNGSFPIHVAASVGSKNAIRFFLSECPDSVGLRDAKKRTLLHVAVEKGRFWTALYVCQSSSLAWILNMQDDDGNTALHLAIQARNFMMFCALFWNRKVNLDILNNKGITPRDLSRSKLPRGMGHGMNSENKISAALRSVGAKQGSLRCDKTEEIYSRQVIPKDEDKESERLRNAAESLMVASVLITTMAFTATFALPGGYRADDHRYGGTPTLAGSYVFDAFVMGTTLAFICSSIATVGFALAAAPMISLFTRRINFVISVLFLLSSVTSLSIAFALGVYMVLSPVARNTAIAVCVISPAVLLSGANVEFVINLTLFALALCNRIGPFKGMDKLLSMYGHLVVVSLWPFVVTFGWAAFARIHRHG